MRQHMGVGVGIAYSLLMFYYCTTKDIYPSSLGARGSYLSFSSPVLLGCVPGCLILRILTLPLKWGQVPYQGCVYDA